MELIAQRAGEPITMTEIARGADVAIGSLYQYFADQSAIYKALLIHHNADVRLMLHNSMESARTMDELVGNLKSCFVEYYALHQKDPFFNGIWCIVQTDAELQKIDVEDTLQNARYLQSIAQPMLPGIDPEKLLAACALMMQFALTAGRLGRAVPPALSREMPAIFNGMMENAFRALAL